MSTTRSDIPAEVNNFYDRNLLDRATPLLVHTRWAQVRDIPRKAGTKTIKFRRYANLSTATTPLGEGITPTGSKMSSTEITATVAQYGDFAEYSDVLNYESVDPILTEFGEILGDQAGETIDTLCRDVIVAGTNVYYGGSATSRVTVAAGDIITTTLIDKAVRTLKNGKARRLTSMVKPSTGHNTTPLNACYVGIVHENITYTLKGLTGFIPVEKYPSQMDVMDGEIGSYGGVRFVETSNSKVFSGEGAAGIDVYGLLIFGANAYGETRISGEAMKNIIKALGSGGTDDPLDQRGTTGWKGTYVSKILNNDYILRIEVAVAA